MKGKPQEPAWAYIYCRWSDDVQTSGDSLARQINLTTNWCERRGYAVDPSRTLVDSGRSAFAGAHLASGVLGRFIQDAQRGVIPKGSVLVVEHYDRIARLPIPTVRLIVDTLTNAGIKIGIAALDHVLDRESGASMMSQMLLLVYAEIAHAASARKSEMQAGVWARKHEEARAGRFAPTTCPRWITRNGDEFVLNENASTTVLIFDMCLNGFGTHAIAKHLNETGIPVLAKPTANGGTMKVARGGVARGWTSSSVMQVLRSHGAYGARLPRHATNDLTHEDVDEEGKKVTIFKLGRMRPEAGEIIEGVYPAVVTKEMFEEVQRIIARRRDGGGNRGRIANVLAGVLFCADCGNRVQRSHARGGYQQDRFYCHSAKMGTCNASGSVMAEPLCREVLNRLREAHDIGTLRHDPARQAMEAQLAAHRAERANQQTALDALKRSLGPEVTRAVAQQFATMADEIERLGRAIAEIEASILRLQTEAARPPAELDDLIAAYHGEPGEERDHAIRVLSLSVRQVIQSVTVVIAGEHKGDWQLVVQGGWATTQRGDDRWYSRLKLTEAAKNEEFRQAVAALPGEGKVIAATVGLRVGPERLVDEAPPSLNRAHHLRRLQKAFPGLDVEELAAITHQPKSAT